jgi:hypothetical protein
VGPTRLFRLERLARNAGEQAKAGPIMIGFGFLQAPQQDQALASIGWRPERRGGGLHQANSDV